jgi:hypothetical protein
MTKNILRDAVLSSLFHDIAQVRDPSFRLQELKPALIEALDQYALSIVEQARIHDEGQGGYCDTGEDMQWSCRSECADLLIAKARRLVEGGEKEYTNNLHLLTDKLKEAGFTEYHHGDA